ncbi:hypothetical protein HFD88_004947 [Aspergillus terreus]|nr:hypothetical protein HFD88_004947 [Aspergillus terreus]
MLNEIPQTPAYDFDPSGRYSRMTDYNDMAQCINTILYKAPRWDHNEYKVGLIGVPFNALFNWPMATESGYQFFKNRKVNDCLEKILNAHGEYLKNAKSQSALPSWFEDEPLEVLTKRASPYWPDGKVKKFQDIYECNPDDEKGCWGFQSWDDFFTRKFCCKDGKSVRPISHPDTNHDPDELSKAVITNACESVVYRCQRNVQKREDPKPCAK